MGFYLVRTLGNSLSYAKADSLAEVLAGFARMRKTHAFILTPSALVDEKILCARCQKRIEPDQANRGTYSPSRKLATVLHYDCAWTGLQEKSLDLGR